MGRHIDDGEIGIRIIRQDNGKPVEDAVVDIDWGFLNGLSTGHLTNEHGYVTFDLEGKDYAKIKIHVVYDDVNVVPWTDKIIVHAGRKRIFEIDID